MSNVTVISPSNVRVDIKRPAPVRVVIAPTIVLANNNIIIDSPNFTGIPTAPTPHVSVNNIQIATTEFVNKLTRFVHTQLTPSTSWLVTHNMNKYPACTVVDSVGGTVVGDIEYNSLNVITITFSHAISGKAYLT